MRTYTPEQRVKRATRSRAHYERNRDAILDRLRSRTPEERTVVQARKRDRYAQDPALRERASEASARYRANPENRPTINAANRKWATSEHGRATKRADRLQRYFGLTGDQYDAMLRAQSGVCAICRQPETHRHRGTGPIVALAVDHDHRCCPGKQSCGKCVRGLLCDRCNVGRFPDDPALLRAAADYFERYQT